MSMIMRTPLIALFVLIATPASAQTVFRPDGMPVADDPGWRVELQRQRSAEQAAFARQQQLDARITALEIEAARRPEPHVREADRGLRTPEQTREAREAATRRREATVAGVTQIDDWLSRGPP